MFRGLEVKLLVAYPRRLLLGAMLFSAAAALAACSSSSSLFGDKPSGEGTPASPNATEIGSGQIKIGLILPLSASGNAGVAAQSLKNAAEMAIAERDGQNIKLLVKDDGGTAEGSQAAAQQAVDEGAELILGPLFGQTVGGVAASRAPRACRSLLFPPTPMSPRAACIC